MLRLKKNVDLKTLEKWGFKPVYNKNTGEIVEYHLEHIKNTQFAKFEKKIKRNYWSNFLGKIKKTDGDWILFIGRYLGYGFAQWQLELVYDLTKVGLIEKYKSGDRYDIYK